MKKLIVFLMFFVCLTLISNTLNAQTMQSYLMGCENCNNMWVTGCQEAPAEECIECNSQDVLIVETQYCNENGVAVETATVTAEIFCLNCNWYGYHEVCVESSFWNLFFINQHFYCCMCGQHTSDDPGIIILSLSYQEP